jgi:hypothetical protein
MTFVAINENDNKLLRRFIIFFFITAGCFLLSCYIIDVNVNNIVSRELYIYFVLSSFFEIYLTKKAKNGNVIYFMNILNFIDHISQFKIYKNKYPINIFSSTRFILLVLFGSVIGFIFPIALLFREYGAFFSVGCLFSYVITLTCLPDVIIFFIEKKEKL